MAQIDVGSEIQDPWVGHARIAVLHRQAWRVAGSLFKSVEMVPEPEIQNSKMGNRRKAWIWKWRVESCILYAVARSRNPAQGLRSRLSFRCITQEPMHGVDCANVLTRCTTLLVGCRGSGAAEPGENLWEQRHRRGRRRAAFFMTRGTGVGMGSHIRRSSSRLTWEAIPIVSRSGGKSQASRH